MNLDDFVVSSCSLPQHDLPSILGLCREIGYRSFEVFTSWAKSSIDYHLDPAPFRDEFERRGMRVHSFHLPPIGDDIEGTLRESLSACRFAKALGAEIVLYKANTRPNYVAAGKRFLDGACGLGLTPVLQNHAGTAVSTLADFREVLDGIGDDRLQALLEVGHFHSVGVGWKEAYEQLHDRVALVHIKDQIGRRSVPFGTGEIDLPGLFARLQEDGYRGKIVIEMEVEDAENTPQYLADALRYVQRFCHKES
jgi:sugar phosphate isomerase/epimerase